MGRRLFLPIPPVLPILPILPILPEILPFPTNLP
jgi:hypothetical protein